MSAAATAAGYLYASGRLRGRAAKEEGEAKHEGKKLRVAALPETPAPEQAPSIPPGRPKRTPTIQYRTRRWRPDGA